MKKGVGLHCRPIAPEFIVKADPLRSEQVLTNLLGNAGQNRTKLLISKFVQQRLRKWLKDMGYSWKKGRFILAKRPSEDDLKYHALGTLKRGRVKDA